MWGPYGPWGPCIGRCRTGIRYRSKICVIAGTNTPTTGCVGAAPQERGTCPLQGCPAWSSWSSFGQCPKTCANGGEVVRRSRSRRCVIEGTNSVTSGCPGASTQQRPCLLPSCKFSFNCFIFNRCWQQTAEKNNKNK